MSWQNDPVVEDSGIETDAWKNDPIISSSDQPQYSQGFFKTYEGEPKGFLQNADVLAGKGANLATNALSAPFEAAGESMRMAAEGLAGKSTEFNAPRLFGGQGGVDPFGYMNKLLRTGAAGITAPLRGQDVMQQAGAEYTRPESSIDQAANVGLTTMAMGSYPKIVSPETNAPGLFRKSFAKGAKILGPSEDATLARLKSPETIKSAGEISNLSQEMPKVADKFTSLIEDLSNKADSTLSTSFYLEEGAIPKDSVMGAIESSRNSLKGTHSSEASPAKTTLDAYAKDYNHLSNTVSQRTIKNLILGLDRDLKPAYKKFENPLNPPLTLEESAMFDLRSSLDDLLKGKNRKYAQIMEPLSEQIRQKKQFISKLGLKRGEKFGYEPGDTTSNRLLGGLRDDKFETKRILKKAQDITGEPILNRVQNAEYLKEFHAPDEASILNPKHYTRPLAGLATDATSKTLGLIDKATPREVIQVAPYGDTVRQDGVTYIWDGNQYVEVQ